LSPADRTKYKLALEEAILSDGVKVVIADKECGITYHRARFKEERKIFKKYGYLPRKTHMNITPEVCENCLECTKATACPGLTTIDTDYGRKIDTDLTWCVNDGACERVRTTNSIADSVQALPQLRAGDGAASAPAALSAAEPGPGPPARAPARQRHERRRQRVAGAHERCGRNGIGIVGAILVRAGAQRGVSRRFPGQKGIGDPQRRGVRSDHVRAPRPDAQPPHVTGSIPYGKANLLLGVDILEAARAIDPREQFRIASPQHTAAVLNLHKQPTVLTLLGRSDFDPEQLRDQIYSHCDASRKRRH